MELFYSLLYMLNQMSPYIMLGFLIAGVMHAFVPQRTFARHLSGTGFKSVVKSAAIGIPLPLCSCGVLPTAIAMRRNGASKAASTSFLISTPQTGVDSIAATWSLLGPAFAAIRPLAALVTALLGGMAVGRFEKVAEPAVEAPADTGSDLPKTLGGKCLEALRYGYADLVGSIGNWLVVGLIVAALITVYVPADYFAIMGDYPLLSMLAVLVIAVPMYVCATGSIPIAMSLILKGLSPGTAFVLLMAGPAANFASVTLISREMGRKSAAVYLASIILGAIAFGLCIDYLMPRSWFALSGGHDMACHAPESSLFAYLCSAVLVVLLLVALVRRYLHTPIEAASTTCSYTVKGMSCTHCQATVLKSILAVDGVTQAEVDLQSGRAIVEGEHDALQLMEAVRKAGFDIEA